MNIKKLVLYSTIILFIALLFSEIFLGENISFKNSQIKKPALGARDNPYEALKFRYNMLKGDKPYLDPLARQRAIAYTKKAMLKKNPDEVNSLSWAAVGPGNIGGRIRSILISSSDKNTILIGSVSGGIWKSTDGGASWLPKADDGNPITIGCMANFGDLVYAGTGEGWGNQDAVYGGGIYKSTDFGDSWLLLSSTTGTNISKFLNILKLAFDPDGNIYAVTKAYNEKDGLGNYTFDGGLYKSTDGGINWSRISSTSIGNYYNGCDAVALSSSTILFATEVDGIFRTTNGGTNWNQVTNGLPTFGFQRIVFAQDPGSLNTIYAVFHSPTGDGLIGIYKSADGGDNWSALTKPGRLASTGNLSYLGDQGDYDNVMAVDPFNANNLYVGGVDMMKSTDGGSSWSQLTYWDPSYGNPVVHADHHVITFDQTTANVLYDGDDGGIYKSTDGGGSWTDLNNGLEITQFYGGAVYPTGNTFFGGTQDNGELKYYGLGTNWSIVEGGDGGYSAVDQSNPLIAYEEYIFLEIEKTTDGSQFNDAINGLIDAKSGASLFIAPFDMNPENSSVLIAGSDKVWMTTNSAGNWTQSSNSLSGLISAVTVVNSSSPYLGFAGTTGGTIFKCTNVTGSGDTWADISPKAGNGVQHLQSYVRRIVVDLNNKQNIYACFSGYNNNTTTQKHVLFSSDQGGQWSDISGDLPDVPVHSLIIDPNNSQHLYIGTETGVYETENRGTNWINSNNGMPGYAPVDQLVRQTGTKNLFAFTHGRSVFETIMPLPVELNNFTSTPDNDKVILNWNTATEINNYGFEVERSTNLSSWIDLGFVKGNGNSNSPKQYSFIDDNPVGGTDFDYRLKQLDNDGHFQYSGIMKVKLIPKNFNLFQNYPNPFNPSTTIKYKIKGQVNVVLKIYDILGNEIETLVNKEQLEGIYELKFDSQNTPDHSQLANGIYLYHLQAGSYSETKKMILLK